MTTYVFTGPSLPHEDARAELDAVFLPPVSEGDITRVMAKRPEVIGIVDGYFANVPSVWHKEILYALSLGIPVFGAASMGALRAAELHPFGMEGVGAVFEAFRDGYLEDDDEVAIIHGPGELGYPILSEAMVNIRRTLSDGLADGVISPDTRARVEAIAKALPYRERAYHKILELSGKTRIPPSELARLKAWLPKGRVDQKREDAIEMLRVIKDRGRKGCGPKRLPFHFEHTTMWEQAVRLVKGRKEVI